MTAPAYLSNGYRRTYQALPTGTLKTIMGRSAEILAGRKWANGSILTDADLELVGRVMVAAHEELVARS